MDLLERAAIRPPTPLYPRVSVQLQAMLEATLTAQPEPRQGRRTAELIGAITGLPLVHEIEAVGPRATVVAG